MTMRTMPGPFLLAMLLGLSSAAACSTGTDATESEGTTPTTERAAGVAVTTTAGGVVTKPPAVDDDGRPVTFDTADGLTLEGRWFGSADKVVVLGHMRPADMTSWFTFAQHLAGNDYGALAFNFRGYGDSEGDTSDLRVDVDTIAAIDFVLAEGADQVWVIGASMGGTGAVVAASQRDVQGVATLSAPEEFQGVDGLAAVPSVDSPLLIIAAERDGDYQDVAIRFAAAAGPNGDARVFKGRQHGTDIFKDHEEALTGALLNFVTSTAG